MKFGQKKAFGFLCVLCVLCGESFSLDREAFSIINYDLDVQIDPGQHRLGARGKVTLRNDTSSPQRIAVLQISSSLDWRSIRVGDKGVQFVRQPYTSDIDHTGSLSEAIVTLPQEVAPHATVDLDIGYEGVVLPDATRLTRIGTPDNAAKNSDWDQIDEKFTAVRGLGHVAWYPVATDVANLSDGDSLFEALARWKSREAGASAHLLIQASTNSVEHSPHLLVSEPSCVHTLKEDGESQLIQANCNFRALGAIAPTFVMADYKETDRPSVVVFSMASQSAAAETYADAVEKVLPTIANWFGTPRGKAETADIPDADAAPFESGALLLTPLSASNPNAAALAAAHQLTHASFVSFHPWIEEGLAHFAQAVYLEQQKGRQSALDYMGMHRTALAQVEPKSAPLDAEQERSRALVNTVSEELYRSKAMCAWWMLRDMIGDDALRKAIGAYKPEEDKDPTYMQRVIAAQTPRDLQWFFDDWVYRDRGLPDFKVESAFASKTPSNGFMLTITLDNLGSAGAEVPVLIKFANGEVSKRIEVRAKSKTTVRVETATAPQEIRVNDGSVPENTTTNNVFKIEPPKN